MIFIFPLVLMNIGKGLSASKYSGDGLLHHVLEPRILSSKKVYKVEVGGEVKLECNVKNLGSMVLLWKQGPRVLTADTMVVRRDKRLRLEGHNLIISNLEPEDTGQYDCEIEADSDRPISVTHKLDILIPPQVTSEPADGNVVVKKGSSVSIKCHASGNPKPHVTWKKVNEDDIAGNGEVMELSKVTRHHEGVYECSASNGVGIMASSKINLRVLHKPEVSAEQETVFTGVGHQAVLVCNVHSSPEAEVIWYRGSLALENDKRMYREDLGTRRSLVIHHVREEEFTQYRCQASNSLGTGEATITISGKPIAPSIDTRVEVLGGGNFKISWRTDSYASIEQYRLLYRKAPAPTNPGQSFAWTSVVIPGPQHTTQDRNRNKATFTLTQLDIEVDYQVQVQAKNAFGWGKVSKQFTFRTNTAETMPVESLRKEYSIFLNNSTEINSSFVLLILSFLSTKLFLILR